MIAIGLHRPTVDQCAHLTVARSPRPEQHLHDRSTNGDAALGDAVQSAAKAVAENLKKPDPKKK
jgi:hypothetical protein